MSWHWNTTLYLGAVGLLVGVACGAALALVQRDHGSRDRTLPERSGAAAIAGDRAVVPTPTPTVVVKAAHAASRPAKEHAERAKSRARPPAAGTAAPAPATRSTPPTTPVAVRAPTREQVVTKRHGRVTPGLNQAPAAGPAPAADSAPTPEPAPASTPVPAPTARPAPSPKPHPTPKPLSARGNGSDAG